MALTRSGAPAPTASSSVSNAQALANRSMQRAAATGNTALQPASPSVPVEITSADGQHFTVSFADIRNFIEPKATDAECKIFLETCKQYKLNPFTKEAYLIHYDNKNDDTASTIVLGKNCYMQMAERNPNFDGFEAGVIVLTADGQLLNREGSIVYDGDGGETLLGGWAKVYRKDRTRASYEEVKLTEYVTGASGTAGSTVTGASSTLWDYEKTSPLPQRQQRPNIEVNQYIYSKAQTAADLMREAQYEQERAVLQGV